MYIRRVHKRSIGVVFFMFAISVFFVLGFLANSVMTPPSVVPEYEIGWIFSSIGFMSEDEIFMAVDALSKKISRTLKTSTRKQHLSPTSWNYRLKRYESGTKRRTPETQKGGP